MKRRDFVIGLVAAIALSSCGLGKHPLVGKWQCVNPKGYVASTTEFLADGTQIQVAEYVSRPPFMKEPYMSDAEWETKKSQKTTLTTTWKAIEGDRISVTNQGKIAIFTYKITGNSLQLDPPDGIKCDRI
jgi:hypothetical protein